MNKKLLIQESNLYIKLYRLFKQLDKNGDGVLTIEEIREGLIGMSDD